MKRDDRGDRRAARMIDPVGLVRQYVQRDAAGERLGPDPWFEEVVTWPMEPAYDSYTVIHRHEVERPPTITGSPARIRVRYEVMGWIATQGEQSVFMEQPGVEVFEFVVLRDDEGWRLSKPQIDQHVLAEVVAAGGSLTPEDAARVRELAAQPPAEP